MLILGLCVAHDAGVALVDDGRVVGLVQKERWDRHKRSALITPDFLDFALSKLGVLWGQVDVVAISACQSWPFLFTDPDRFRIDVCGEIPEQLNAPREVAEVARGSRSAFERHEAATISRVREIAEGLYGEYFSVDVSHLTAERNAAVSVEWPGYLKYWVRKTIDGVNPAEALAQSINYSRPGIGYAGARVTFEGTTKPAIIVPHHLAHAAYSFYQSGEDRAAIATLDNGDVATSTGGYVGGVLAEGCGNRIRVLDFRYAYEGHFYQRIAEFIGLGHGSGAGKLMGLAPYGEPTYFDNRLVGDAREVFGEEYCRGVKGSRSAVIEPILRKFDFCVEGLECSADELIKGVDPSGFGAKDLTVQKVNLAATAQKLMEHCTLNTIENLYNGYRLNQDAPSTLVLGGGVALNCPANSLIAGQGLFERVLVPPAVDDSGLPLGAAQAVAHDVLGLPRLAVDPHSAQIAYLGDEFDQAQIERAIGWAGDGVQVVSVGEPTQAAAEDLFADRIVAWFEGRSEVGPRALGHRSILADARHAENWRRVNRLKKREEWRPFAPVVLKEKANEWFDGPLPSAHMLFTAKVKRMELPAITHVDGSARIQTVGTECGDFRGVLEHFEKKSGVPVLLNTSFNGPREPIVETPQDALGYLLTSEIDALYMEGIKVVRKEKG